MLLPPAFTETECSQPCLRILCTARVIAPVLPACLSDTGLTLV